MKDYYNTLGIDRSASADDIKKAFRKAAMQHHPDRGGDQARFKEINEAYDILSNNEKKKLYDSGIDPLNPNQGGHHRYHSGPQFNDMEDIFNSFGFSFNFGGNPNFRNRQMKNKTLNVNLNLSLEEAYLGVDKSLSIRYPSGKEKIINVSIPPGVDNGMAIRYSGMGDDEFNNIPPGDLNVIIHIENHPVFNRQGPDLITDINITCFEAILGTSVDIVTLDKRTLSVTIPGGTQSGTMLSLKGEGMKDQRGFTGKLYVRTNITIPKVNDPAIMLQIKNLNNLVK